jgi:hypothetical protein
MNDNHLHRDLNMTTLLLIIGLVLSIVALLGTIKNMARGTFLDFVIGTEILKGIGSVIGAILTALLDNR